jgi:transcriptional regulator with XRE-family HTH domain
MYGMRVKHEPQRLTPEQIAGRKMALLRQERGWSQAQTARSMKPYGYNWAQSTVARIESGERPLRLNEVVHVAALFNVSPIELLVPTSTPGRLKEDIKASEEGREFVRRQLEEAKAELARHSDAVKNYERLERELQRADMHLAALYGLQEAMARRSADDA